MASASNPCTGVCKFRQQICLSCGRLRTEKKRWKKMNKTERREVVSQSAARLAALGDQAIPSKKARRKAKKRAAAQFEHPPATPVRVRPHDLALGEPVLTPDAPLPIVDADSARDARKAWKKARKLARKAKKAARKAREAEARARGLPPSEHARAALDIKDTNAFQQYAEKQQTVAQDLSERVKNDAETANERVTANKKATKAS